MPKQPPQPDMFDQSVDAAAVSGDMSDAGDERGFFIQSPVKKTGSKSVAAKLQDRSPNPSKDSHTDDHFLGHRDRLRKRFQDQGDAALADYEILELLLFRMIPRRDTKPIAKALLARFGSLAGVLGADVARLEEISGIGPSVAVDLKLVSAIAHRTLKAQIHGKQVLSSWASVIDYCHAAMAHETREQFRVLFMDKRNALIADEIQQKGTVDHTPVYPREVVKRALELSATAVILVHNHPSGDPTPSRADIDMTKMIADTAKPLGIIVHDHIIIGKEGHASLKGMRLF